MPIVLFAAGCEVYNLGTGKGTSVLEMVSAFEKASGKVPVETSISKFPVSKFWNECASYTSNFVFCAKFCPHIFKFLFRSSVSKCLDIEMDFHPLVSILLYKLLLHGLFFS